MVELVLSCGTPQRTHGGRYQPPTAAGRGGQLLDALLGHLQIAPALAGAVAAVELDWLPTKDRPVLAAAIRLGCDALVTGDRKHFGSAYGLKANGVTIHPPRSQAETVLA